MATYDALSVSEWMLANVIGVMDAADARPVYAAFTGIGTIPWDNCCGQLSVSPERIYTSTVFPAQDASEVVCGDPTVAVVLATMLVRCVPVVNAQGTLSVSPQEQADAHAAVLCDAGLIWSAHESALPDDEWSRAGLAQEFVGAEGGCVAVVTRTTIGIPAAQWCPG